VNIDPNTNEIIGSIHFKDFPLSAFRGVTTYFVFTVDNSTDFGVWTNGTLSYRQTNTNECSSGAYIILSSNQEQQTTTTVYVGISFVSIEQAHMNLQSTNKTAIIRYTS